MSPMPPLATLAVPPMSPMPLMAVSPLKALKSYSIGTNPPISSTKIFHTTKAPKVQIEAYFLMFILYIYQHRK
jgi:hypothetical protein